MAVGCHYCGSIEREMRPYGPGGAAICYLCMKATPEREAAAFAAFGALLDSAEVLGGGVVTIGGPRGPEPGVSLP